MDIYPKSEDIGIRNMATDWWVFENAKKPSFRHYRWTRPETSFGYGQDWEWVEKVTSLSVRELIRRPTGGGVVRHGQDWTYCMVLPEGHASCKIPPLDLYKEVHQCIEKAFSERGLQTQLQPCPTQKKKIIPGDCFREPVGWDLMNVDLTRKIAGAAMKRSRKGLLLQGTIEIDQDWNIDVQEFENSFIYFLSQVLEEPNDYVSWPANITSEIEKISDQFSDLEWKKHRVRI